MIKLEIIKIFTDILIIGGGTSGCQSAIHAKELNPELDVLIVEKAAIKRSGCLAAGVNAINAYLPHGETPESYVEYVKKESHGLIREDLTLSIGKKLNNMTKKLEDYGLVFLKDEDGRYVIRGERSIKINGENIKPILAEKTRKSGAEILNKTIATDYIVENGKVAGTYGLSLDMDKFYVIKSKVVICTTGGASGIYKPNNPTEARHKMWYSPFNTGDGLAMGIRAGAEMTSFEMRFIALRTKDTISPTGTIAQGLKVGQINSLGEDYMKNYENRSTPMRLYASIIENLEGRGPCFLDTRKATKEQIEELKKAYLNMSPSILLKWHDENTDISKEPVEICGSEPYIVGGHGQAGYWIDYDRSTSLKGLYAAGDVCGGSPKKYVTGCMAESDIAVESAIEYIKKVKISDDFDHEKIDSEMKRVLHPLNNKEGKFSPQEIEEKLQKIMDEYAGGISEKYRMNEEKLLKAKKLLKNLDKDLKNIKTETSLGIFKYNEVINRTLVAKVLVEHLLYRKETRWKCYQERSDYPDLDNKNWFKFINSLYDKNKDNVKIIERDFRKVI
ncbi:adenylyl-sulfate reductase subunit alpha [uncultured Ilyobacter sp.]|uniref:adenylyl-sulfate reductase subunit alpha n=1 Tax=uncultured Ilyobacter sp. TaxID=544433 RepID=UPI0029F518DF|nr:adenylyl-sulfate reductase subunit alpha [uncultured Ilyobacter sp.]